MSRRPAGAPAQAPALGRRELQAAIQRTNEQLEHARKQAAKLDARNKEYDEVRGIVQDLPEKVQHPIMVPFGPLAFFPGHLEHTNEVLTQLSSEYFALRTTKDALRMVDRRQERLARDRKDVAGEIRQLEMRLGVASGEEQTTTTVPGVPGASIRRDQDGFLDIREPYVDEEEAKGAAAAARPVSGAMGARDLAEEPERGATGGTSTVSSSMHSGGGGAGGDLLARLRELEREEEEQDDDKAKPAEEADELKGLDALLEAADRGDLVDLSATGSGAAATTAGSAPTGEVKSPADLFRAMQRVEEAGAREVSLGSGYPLGPTPGGILGGGIAGSVRERSVADSAGALPQPALAEAAAATPKRVSKFRAERQRAAGQ